MRPRLLAASLVVTGLAIAACFNDRSPTAPQTIDPSKANWTLNRDGCVLESGLDFAVVNPQVGSLILQLFEGSHEASTAAMWENIKKDKLEGKPIQNHIDNLASWTLEKLAARALVDPDGPTGLLNATTGSVRLLDLIFDCTGVVPTQLPEPPADFDAAWELVNPTTFSQQFNTNVGDAGAWVPPAEDGVPALDGTTLLVLVRQPPEIQVNTPFPKVTNTIDVALAGGKLTTGRKLSILFCAINENLDPAINNRAVIAHQFQAVPPGSPPGAGVEYLDAEEGGALDCHGLSTASWQSEKGFLRQRAMQVAWYAKKAWRSVSPKPLYAAHAAIGGSDDFIDGFSPMVGVDPYVGTSITDVSIPTTTYGETINFNATLRVSSVTADCVVSATNPTPPAVCGWVGLPVTASLPGIPALTLSALQITAVVDGQTQADAINSDGVANFSFTGVNAGENQTANLSFPNIINEPANAPEFGGSNASATYTVNRRELVVTADNKPDEGAPPRFYGDANPDLTGSLVGVQYGENITATYTTSANALSDVGAYPIVAGVAFGPGVRAENYTGSTAAAGDVETDFYAHNDGSLTISPAPLSITSNNVTREYGVANPSPSDPYPWTRGNIAGLKNGQTFALQHAITLDQTTDVGTYLNAVTPSVVGLSANYVITTVDQGDLQITPAPISFTIDAGTTHVYGDANNFTSNLGATRNGDVLTVGFSPSAATLLAVGTHVISGTLSGPEVGNYSFATPTSSVVITPRALTGTIDDKTKTQGQPNPDPLTGSVGNTVAGDGFAVNYVTTATTSSPVGEYPITVDLTAAGGSNYSWDTANDGTLTINSADLPDPVLAYRHSEQYTANDMEWDRYRLTVTNRASYPASLFAIDPDAPACASNALVNIYNGATNAYIYGFCGLSAPDQLNDIWFAVPRWTQPPASVYITITDQAANVTYTSNTINLYAPLFVNFPRTVLVNGNNSVVGAATYELEVQRCDSWGSPDWRNCTTDWVPETTQVLAAGVWSSSFVLSGDNVGRWRVVAKDGSGTVISATAYQAFRFITGPGAP